MGAAGGGEGVGGGIGPHPEERSDTPGAMPNSAASAAWAASLAHVEKRLLAPHHEGKQ